MLSKFKSFFDRNLKKATTEGPDETVKKLNLACAALMIEVMNSDHQLDDREEAEFIEFSVDSFYIQFHAYARQNRMWILSRKSTPAKSRGRPLRLS